MSSGPVSEEPPYDEEVVETPLERAARVEQQNKESQSARDDARDEHEADVVIGDVGDYIAQTASAATPDADAQLNAWEIPTDPLEGVPSDAPLHPGEEGEPFVSVFSAGTESEANIVRGLLESEGIPVVFRDSSSPAAYGSVFGIAEARWGDLLVGAAQADLARQIIAAAQEPSPVPSLSSSNSSVL